MKTTLFILILSGLISSCTTTYYIVRHAEKADNSSDPPLSAAGNLRSVALKDSLLSKVIYSIYVTNLQRTQLTAMPLAQAIGKTPAIFPATTAGTQQLIQELKRFTDQRSMLVVGHSNTIPIIIDSLTGRQQNIIIPEEDFDNFYIVTVKRCLSVKRKLTVKTYGTPSP